MTCCLLRGVLIAASCLSFDGFDIEPIRHGQPPPRVGQGRYFFPQEEAHANRSGIALKLSSNFAAILSSKSGESIIDLLVFGERSLVERGDLDVIFKHSGLKSLWVCDVQLVSLDGIEQLSSLHTLRISNSKLQDDCLSTLGSVKRLSRLLIDRSVIHPEALCNLHGLEQLVHLDLNRSQLAPAPTAACKLQFPNLTVLSAVAGDEKLVGVLPFQDMPSLKVLNVFGMKSVSKLGPRFRHLKSLEEIHFGSYEAETEADAAILRLGELPTLKRVALAIPPGSSPAVQSLSELPLLEALFIGGYAGEPSTLPSFAALANAQKLTYLELDGNWVGMKVLSSLAQCKQIREMRINSESLDRECVLLISQTLNLKSLVLDRISCSLRDLEPLRRMRSLKTLEINEGTADSSEIDSLKSLLPGLTVLHNGKDIGNPR